MGYDATYCKLLVDITFGGTYCIHFQGRIATVKIEVIYFSQMLVPSYNVLLLFTCLMN
jgi:hypothetical protein